MAQHAIAAGGADAGDTTTDFDEADELLQRMFAFCSPEQKLRGRTPREVLTRLSATERVEVVRRLRAAEDSASIGHK